MSLDDYFMLGFVGFMFYLFTAAHALSYFSEVCGYKEPKLTIRAVLWPICVIRYTIFGGFSLIKSLVAETWDIIKGR